MVVFTSGGKAGLHFSFVRHLENRLREEFDFFATPIRIVERHKTKGRRRQESTSRKGAKPQRPGR
jgi:GTP-binding protein